MNIPKNWYWIIIWTEFYCEMNEWIIFWSDICRFWWKALFSCLFLTLSAIFGPFSFSTSIHDPLTIKLNHLLNWIGILFLELNNILNWILGKAILNRILNESFFGKIQIPPPYPALRNRWTAPYQIQILCHVYPCQSLSVETWVI